MEGKYGAAVVVQVGVEAGESAELVGFAGEAVDAVVVVLATAAEFVAVRSVRGVRQSAEIIIKGMVFLHDHNDVFNFMNVTVGPGRLWRCER